MAAVNPEEGSAVEMLVHFFGVACRARESGDQVAAENELESAAFWLERRGEHLGLAEAVVRDVLARAPSRRRQLLLVRILLRSGKERDASELELRLLPRNPEEEIEYQRMRAEFLTWFDAWNKCAP